MGMCCEVGRVWCVHRVMDVVFVWGGVDVVVVGLGVDVLWGGVMTILGQ